MRFVPGLIIGAAVGAVLAWLYSPRSGRENRRALLERGAELGSNVDELWPGASEQVLERARSVMEQQRARLNRAAGEARQATEHARQKLTERYESAKRGEEG